MTASLTIRAARRAPRTRTFRWDRIAAVTINIIAWIGIGGGLVWIVHR